MTVPRTFAASQWNLAMTLRAKNLVAGVAHAQELHPGKMILLHGVDTELFMNGIKDRPFRLAGSGQVFLAPGSERAIDAAGAAEYTLPSIITSEVLNRGEAVVYDASAPLLRNITEVYKAMPRDAALPSRVDAGNPLMAAVLGPEWYANDGNHRWMPRRASLRMAAPTAPGQMLYLRGNCSEEQLRDGPLRLIVAINNDPPQAAEIRATSFDVKFPLPSSMIVGRPEMRVTLEVDRTFRPAGDARDLGLAFGMFEVR
jgi:hypothetical protein